jgi:hypothetical protein
MKEDWELEYLLRNNSSKVLFSISQIELVYAIRRSTSTSIIRIIPKAR